MSEPIKQPEAQTEAAMANSVQRMVQRLAHYITHLWDSQMLKNGNTIFYTRKCRVCGMVQVRQSGPLGNGEWRDVKLKWMWEWEREQFDAATPYNE